MATLKIAYEIQIKFAETVISLENGYSYEESLKSFKWIDRIAHIASHLGWNHEIIRDFYMDDYPDMFKKVPSNFIQQNLLAWYECLELIIDNGGIKMDV